MSEIKRHFNLRNQLAAKTLLRWNRNYFEWLEKFLGTPSEFGDNLRIIWINGRRKAIYSPELMLIQLHEQTDEQGVYWKLCAHVQYPTKNQIERCANWLKSEINFEVI